MGQRVLWLPWRREREPARPRSVAEPETRPVDGDELQARRAEIARMEERALREIHSLELQREDLDRR